MREGGVGSPCLALADTKDRVEPRVASGPERGKQTPEVAQPLHTARRSGVHLRAPADKRSTRNSADRDRPAVVSRIVGAVGRQSSWLLSLLVHLLLLVVLALVTLPGDQLRETFVVLQVQDAEAEPVLDLLPMPDANPETPPGAVSQIDPALVTEMEAPVPLLTVPDLPTVSPSPTAVSFRPNIPEPIGGEFRGGIVGRTTRRSMATQHGATPASEAAVDEALAWLVRHQLSDGSWSFGLDQPECDCEFHGAYANARIGATALALLPFLGAGQTHERGAHREAIERGLLYLMERQEHPSGSLWEPLGTMYSHGIASLVLCEALAMSATDPGAVNPEYHHQPRLHGAAQRATKYIVKAQHKAGGWRYRPNQYGDTSVLGWQLMALHSARMAGLTVPKSTFTKAAKFLHQMQSGRYGGMYGYQDREAAPGTTAVGLLSRMYLGWKRSHPGIHQGVRQIDEWRLSYDNLYYNYYAIQVLHHVRGDVWEKWHPVIRDHLVEQQETEGHAAGSWYFDDESGAMQGGRLYTTAMATMILQVYYRHMPIYSDAAVPQPRLLGD